MNFTYEQKKKQENKKNGAEPFGGSGEEFSLPNSALFENPGHQVDMPVVMREKMEGAFGMDLSSVKLYENRAVGKAGAEAVAQGSKIAFAPGKLDFSSTRGQALLGHEISHVASQARGEVKGSGFLNDSALEARADREGLKAARGETVAAGYGGAAAPLSNASAVSAAGPMQAKSGKKKQPSTDVRYVDQSDAFNNSIENGIVSSLPPIKRSVGGTILDWFRTTGSHWNKKTRSKKNRIIMDRADADTKAMLPMFDPFDKELDDEED